MAAEPTYIHDILHSAVDIDEELDVQVRRMGGVWVISLSGDVDAYTCSKLRGAILNLPKHEDLQVVIRMVDVGYIDSSGLSILVGAFLTISEQNGDFAIAGASPHVRKAISVTGLGKILPLFSREEDAVQSFESGGALLRAA